MQDKIFKLNNDGAIISEEADILDIFGKIYQKNKLLLHSSNLSPNSFDLSTGLAGDVLQKMVNYQVSTALVVDLSKVKSQKFKEMANEASMKNVFRFFESEEDAVK